jgi:hypothetical protein
MNILIMFAIGAVAGFYGRNAADKLKKKEVDVQEPKDS